MSQAWRGEGSFALRAAGARVPGAFLNDIVVTREAAYITDSLGDELWTVPLDRRGLPSGPATPIALSGDFTFVTPADVPPDALLLANHTTLGVLYRIDPSTGVASVIDLTGAIVPFGDGLVLHGRTLYVVQNFLNQVAVVELSRIWRPDT